VISSGNTIPGESSKDMLESREMVWMFLVNPGVAPVETTRERLRELMRDDLPTFGYPMTPTVMDVFMSLLRE